MNECSRTAKKTGFTIVELLVVIVVIGILAAITIVSYGGVTNRANVSAVSAELASISQQLRLDQVITGAYPATLAVANNGNGVNLHSGSSSFYASNNVSTPISFCLAITKNNTTYKINEDSVISPGNCQSYGLVMNVDAGDSDSYPGAGTTWTDTSSGGHNCTLSNGAVYNAGGGGSISFDGIDDYAGCGTITPANSHSIETWVKMNALTGGNADQIGLGYTVAATSSLYGSWVSVYGTEVIGRAYTANTTNHLTSSANLNASSWFHIVMTAIKNGPTKMYVNGVLKGSFTAETTDWAGTFTIGDLRANRLIGFSGLVAKMAVYNRVQSDVEILNNFNSQKSRYGL
jgi:general secretion pathway protein G